MWNDSVSGSRLTLMLTMENRPQPGRVSCFSRSIWSRTSPSLAYYPYTITPCVGQTNRSALNLLLRGYARVPEELTKCPEVKVLVLYSVFEAFKLKCSTSYLKQTNFSRSNTKSAIEALILKHAIISPYILEYPCQSLCGWLCKRGACLPTADILDSVRCKIKYSVRSNKLG